MLTIHYVAEHNDGMKVSGLYIAQVKKKDKKGKLQMKKEGLKEQRKRILNGKKEEINVNIYENETSHQGLLFSDSGIRISLIAFIFTLIMTVMNIVQGYYAMAVSTGLMVLGAIIGFVLYIKKQYKITAVLFGIVFGMAMTGFTVTGSNEGFAVLWTLLIPSISMWFWGYKEGLCMSFGYLGLFVLLFYTPLKENMVYTETFMNRYPVLFTLSILVSNLIMKEYYTYQKRQYAYQNYLHEIIEGEKKKVTDISLQSILSISNAVDAKDTYTREHSQRVANYSCLIAKELGWSQECIDDLEKIALLHDIGKIGIKDAVLNKPSRLTDEEYEIIKQHTVIGANILKDLTTLPNVSLGAKYHHERYDGKGYPSGIKGEEIPIEARIIGIADAYDAMASARVYRKGMDMEYILNEFEKGKGTQFDPELAEIFLQIIKRNTQEFK